MTYNPDIAEIEPRSEDEWLNLIIEDGTSFWGEDITERDGTSIHQFYRPYAGRLAELERELKKVHEALRLVDAEGQELDYIGERLGVARLQARRATGEVTFSRSTQATKDYLIQKGTVVETGGDDSIEFVTTEKVVLNSGDTSVTAPIEAEEKGSKANVGAGTIDEDPGRILGIEAISNANPTSGGRDVEADDSYRNRIQTSVGEIDTTSGQQIYNTLTAFDFIKEVRYIDNSADVAQNNLDPHEAEVIVDAEPGYQDDIAQAVWDNLAMGANLISGNHGTAETGTASLPNGQTFTVDYSVPSDLDIYADIDVTIDGNLDKSDVKNAIIEYIGGVKTNGEKVYGKLSVGDDVLYGEVDFSVRQLESVYDITTLKIDTSSSPSGTSNISVGVNERASIDESNITVTITEQ